MLRLSRVLGLAFLLTLAGCRTGDNASGVKEEDGVVADAGVAAIGVEGGTCGGIANLQCQAGLECVGTGPGDQAGICKKPAALAIGVEGATCGGIAALPCNSGLECVGTGPGDQAGKCTKIEAPQIGTMGATCGGLAVLPCNQGLICIGTGPGDQSGTCQKPAGGICATQPLTSACCAAQIPSCMSCKKKNKDLMAAWKKSCDPPNGACLNLPKTGACCAAQTPSCMSCKKKNSDILAKWHKQCDAPGGSAGGGSTIGQEGGMCGGIAALPCQSGLNCLGQGPTDQPGKCMTVPSCDQQPDIGVCCQAETQSCKQCKRIGKDMMAAWHAKCG